MVVLHARVRAAVRDLGGQIVAAEQQPPHARNALLDRLYALQRPSLHVWWRHWCMLCEPPDIEHGLEWLDVGERGVCIVCVRATSLLAIAPDVDGVWPSCQAHAEPEIIAAITRMHDRLRNRKRQ